ncbi:hypothetical protein [uncultured Microscilla sp.]|uniref:hypothetical protein n=1 Tax=uncultured Microscilla sp. TaxID=432653 RepID=UPI0026206D7C|nr:hypothetical protein [uncultured Microscilla sp.]
MNKIRKTEIPLRNMLGLKFNLYQTESLENDFKDLYQRYYNEDITLFVPDYPPIELVVVKMGYLDLVFERKNNTEDKYLHVLMTSENAGIHFFDGEQSIYNFRDALANWEKAFDSLKKPVEFIIKDICHTNTRHIWKDKYFYL